MPITVDLTIDICCSPELDKTWLKYRISAGLGKLINEAVIQYFNDLDLKIHEVEKTIDFDLAYKRYLEDLKNKEKS